MKKLELVGIKDVDGVSAREGDIYESLVKIDGKWQRLGGGEPWQVKRDVFEYKVGFNTAGYNYPEHFIIIGNIYDKELFKSLGANHDGTARRFKSRSGIVVEADV